MDSILYIFTVGILIILLLLGRLFFLRSPKRFIPNGPFILSPADGRIIEIATFNKPKNAKRGKNIIRDNESNSGIMISIFLSLFDVHYQRAPVEGTVSALNYIPGHHFPALSTKAETNERNEILVYNEELGQIKIIQTAGILARRIRCFVNQGDRIQKGQIIGLIKFGSRVTFFFPEAQLKIKKGQKVKAGQTIIAEYKPT